MKYNIDSGQHQHSAYGDGVFGSEAVFAPKAGAGFDSEEDDGYVITLVTDSRNWESHCLVYDARDIAPGPIARVKMPHRVPAGFHATWARPEDMRQTVERSRISR